MNKDAVAEMSQQYQVEAAKKIVPEGYKQTEVGVIPGDWEVLTLKKIASVIDSLHQTPTFSENGYSMVRVADIKSGNLKLEKTQKVDFKVYLNFTRNYKPVLGDIVLSRVGSYGVSSYVATDEPFCLGQNTVVINSKINSKYLYYILNGPSVELQIEDGSYGSGYKSLSLKNINDLFIAVPSDIEQSAIANALSDTDALLSELENLIAKKQAIKTATMQQLFTGRTHLPKFAHHPDGSKKGYKQSELGEMPEDWEVVQLGEIATFLKGAGLPKSDLIDGGKNRCIHYGQLFTAYGPKIEKILSSTDIDGSIKSETNDVLMPTSDVTPNGLATASCILESGIVLGGDILVIRSKKELLNGVFFAYLITVMRDQIMQLVTGSTVYHLYGSDMAKFFFARPTIEEQTAIATILSDMDAEIQALEQRLNKTRQIKQGMMQELLTGKTRLIVGGKNV